MIDSYIFSAIFLGALVTWLPRVFPYILTKFAKPSPKIIKFLSFLPITIIFSLVLSGICIEKQGQLLAIKWVELLAVVITFYTIVKTKNVMISVVVGIICVAILRLLAT